MLMRVEVEGNFANLGTVGEVAYDHTPRRGAHGAGLERHDREIDGRLSDLMDVHVRAGAGGIQQVARRRAIGKEVDFGRSARAHQRRPHRGRPCRQCLGLKLANRLADVGQMRGWSAMHRGLQRVANHAEVVTRPGCGYDFERLAPCLVKPGAVGFARTHPRAQVEDQRAGLMMGRRRPAPDVQPRQRHRERAERGHLEPEHQVGAQHARARHGRGDLVEQHQAGNLERGLGAGAQINRDQHGQAREIGQVAWIEQAHRALPHQAQARKFAHHDVVEMARAERPRIYDSVGRAERRKIGR